MIEKYREDNLQPRIHHWQPKMHIVDCCNGGFMLLSMLLKMMSLMVRLVSKVKLTLTDFYICP